MHSTVVQKCYQKRKKNAAFCIVTSSVVVVSHALSPAYCDQYFSAVNKIQFTPKYFAGLLQSEGDLWKEHRRFALSALRDLGMGKSWLENAILDEVLELVAVFKRYGGTTCNPRPHLTVAVSNVICALIFGKRFEHSDTRFLKLCSVFGENVRMLNTVTPVEFFPILKYIPFGKIYKTWGLFFENIHYVKNFVQSLVAEHVERLVENKEEVGAKGDYIDSYLVEREKHRRQEKASSFTGKLGQRIPGPSASSIILPMYTALELTQV